MKLPILAYILTSALLITGCQSFQFVDSPIPVNTTPTNSILVKNMPATTVQVQNNTSTKNQK
ncbi:MULTISPECIES: hypothetical protein [unclassified Psychrobacter]|uniref:hypothetical protein n=1 Tax=unclassified Psychrobacter TaxID=196806 RepID=UPI0004364B48|nr:hypothetical protein [Psychrobacter sp. JCM 18903]GAF60837.1 hypothetical protein JCM18903_784 [Psychrobacter sp. JCM 18903]